jgi:hypothetical protein
MTNPTIQSEPQIIQSKPLKIGYEPQRIMPQM